MPIKKICCIGAGYVGGPTSTVIALKCPDIQVWVTDLNAERIRMWNSKDLPIFEPGLGDIVNACRGRNLFFSTEVEKHVADADLIFISVNTPTKAYGVGKGKAPDMTSIESAARMIGRVAMGKKIVVEKSTVPVKAAESIKRILQAAENKNAQFEVLSNPEFLAEGSAVQNLFHPDRVLIGADQTTDGCCAARLLAEIYEAWVPASVILTVNTWSSELAKLYANAMLAQRISSVNAASELCEVTGADVSEVAKAVGMDSRIGSKFLEASIGFGGSCFQKDILSLVYLYEHYGLQNGAEYWRQIIVMNEYQRSRFCRIIVSAMFNTVARKQITIFGFAFKQNTGDTRESSSITVGRYLLEEGARVNIYDPEVLEHVIISDLTTDSTLQETDQGLGMNSLEVKLRDRVTVCHNAYKAAAGSHAIVICTEWDLFKALDYEEIYTSMQKPAFIFDGKMLLNHAALKAIGFEVHCIGKRIQN
ncbi:UDP-glucose 6-dehydrogenase [Hypsibius exemplaris]|uniref:UDP-glucose 6-dehydrogenase n=1 Tax=Hypsibius exemplaris TaxID=2072580 RepID=A0A9X6NEP9_HYPEX|nr:UDP-glucose 6-dehydrogenase [Hypsibius exemplaris]